MKIASTAAVALLGLGTLALTATNAAAAVACNGEGWCWHTPTEYTYKPEFGIVVHPNDWKWGATERFAWHEHEGRGYWRNGVWITF